MSILADAMSADAATVAPTKRGRKAWLIALAVVVAVVTIALLANAPKPEPVKVWFVRATNEAGVKRLVFEGTNALPREGAVFACVATGAVSQIKTTLNSAPFYDELIVDAGARTNFYFALNAPATDIPYCVKWGFNDTSGPKTRWARIRMGCYNFFDAHGMRRVALRFMSTLEMHYIPSTEIKE